MLTVANFCCFYALIFAKYTKSCWRRLHRRLLRGQLDENITHKKYLLRTPNTIIRFGTIRDYVNVVETYSLPLVDSHDKWLHKQVLND